MNKKNIIVCADDFGMNASIDAGMLTLAGAGRLSAISCLSLGPVFASGAAELLGLDIDVGLHLNFTEALGQPDEPIMSLKALIMRAYAGRLNTAWVEAAIIRQLDAFEAALGQAPDYVDGHQHVHQLPGIRERLLDVLQRRYGQRMPWLRHTAPGALRGIGLGDTLKAQLIGALGARTLARQARCAGIRMNRRLLGVYDFQGGTDRYGALLQDWLRNAADQDLLMCHPARSSWDQGMSLQRAAEFQVWIGPALPQWLDEQGLRIARLAS